VDEIGYLPIDHVGANLFFQLISRRYERGPMILTSNQSFGSWGEVFGDRVIATAILDRILHHAITVNIRGNSIDSFAGGGPRSSTRAAGTGSDMEISDVKAKSLPAIGSLFSLGPREVVIHRDAPKKGSWAQWEGVWQKRGYAGIPA